MIPENKKEEIKIVFGPLGISEFIMRYLNGLGQLHKLSMGFLRGLWECMGILFNFSSMHVVFYSFLDASLSVRQNLSILWGFLLACYTFADI